MYNLETLKRLIQKNGFQYVFDLLSNDDLSKDIKLSLTKEGIFTNGFLNVSFLYALV